MTTAGHGRTGRERLACIAIAAVVTAAAATEVAATCIAIAAVATAAAAAEVAATCIAIAAIATTACRVPWPHAKAQFWAADCGACAGWYVEEAGGRVHTTIAIYSLHTRATPAARAMAGESQEELQEATLIESPSPHGAAPRVDAVL